MQTKHSISKAFCGALALLLALQACGDDDNDNPTPPDDVTPSAGTSAKGGSSGKGGSGNTDPGGADNGESGKGGKSSGGGTKNTGGTGNTGNEGGGEPVEVGGGGAGPDPGPACDPLLGEDGCFNCPANGEQKEWLNRCLDSDCEPFDNSATRLPLLNSDGSLPDLPN